jgi:hypothetical protein
MLIDRPARSVYFSEKTKGDQRRDEVDKPVLTILTLAKPILAGLLEYNLVNHTAFCNKIYECHPPSAMWRFSPLEHSTD